MGSCSGNRNRPGRETRSDLKRLTKEWSTNNRSTKRALKATIGAISSDSVNFQAQQDIGNLIMRAEENLRALKHNFSPYLDSTVKGQFCEGVLGQELEKAKRKCEEAELQLLEERKRRPPSNSEEGDVKFRALQQKYFQSERERQQIVGQCENVQLKCTEMEKYCRQLELDLTNFKNEHEMLKTQVENFKNKEENRKNKEDCKNKGGELKKPEEDNVPETPEEEHERKSLKRVREIKGRVEELEQEIGQFQGRETDRTYLHLKEMLIREQLKIDDIDSEGNLKIRKSKKFATQHIQLLMDSLQVSVQQ